MNYDHLLYFVLGFVVATILIVGIGFYWIKRRWKMMLFGLGSKLFSKGIQHVSNRAQERANDKLREVGRQ